MDEATPDSDDGDVELPADGAVVVRTTWTNDLSLFVIGLALTPLFAWGAMGALNESGPAGHGLAAEVLTATPILPIGSAVLALWLVPLTISAGWRLIDRTPAIVADRSGVTSHPAMGPRFTPWRDIEDVRWARERWPANIEIIRRRKFWSLWNPFATRTLRLNYRATGLGYADVRQRALQMRRLRAEAPLGCPDGG